VYNQVMLKVLKMVVVGTITSLPPNYPYDDGFLRNIELS